MRVFISYFYQVRNLKYYQIPISTAKYDPRWYHQNESRSKVFKDDKGLYIGIRMEELVFPEDKWDKLVGKGQQCDKDCKFYGTNCEFMKQYAEYLRTLDFKEVYGKLEKLAELIQKTEKFDEEPEIILLVHESPDTNCAERPVLKEWFKENGVILEEWSKYAD